MCGSWRCLSRWIWRPSPIKCKIDGSSCSSHKHSQFSLRCSKITTRACSWLCPSLLKKSIQFTMTEPQNHWKICAWARPSFRSTLVANTKCRIQFTMWWNDHQCYLWECKGFELFVYIHTVLEPDFLFLQLPVPLLSEYQKSSILSVVWLRSSSPRNSNARRHDQHLKHNHESRMHEVNHWF